MKTEIVLCFKLALVAVKIDKVFCFFVILKVIIIFRLMITLAAFKFAAHLVLLFVTWIYLFEFSLKVTCITNELHFWSYLIYELLDIDLLIVWTGSIMMELFDKWNHKFLEPKRPIKIKWHFIEFWQQFWTISVFHQAWNWSKYWKVSTQTKWKWKWKNLFSI